MRWAILVVVAGCYQPNAELPCTVTCGPGGTCPGSLTCDNGVCKRNGGCTVADDAATDATADGDLPFCYGHVPSDGLFRICVATLPSQRPPIVAPTMINTDDDNQCTVVAHQSSDVRDDACVLLTKDFVISQDGSLRAFGRRPLVIVASNSITILGALDVSSTDAPVQGLGAGADPRGCNAATAAQMSGGGAGGSFGRLGGRGGGDASGSGGGLPGAPPAATTIVRGGCPGAAGANSTATGPGGGAVYLIASTSITLESTIDASGSGGGGGNIAGGGAGGGAGGLIGLDTPSLTGPGSLVANGGGGGCGGSSTSSGGNGDGGGVDTIHTGAPGCMGGQPGGTGGFGVTAAQTGAAGGSRGGGMIIGGGGGGGSVGVIFFGSAGAGGFGDHSP